jgi:hypothetical protein
METIADDLVLAVESLIVVHDRTDYQMSDGADGDTGDSRDP